MTDSDSQSMAGVPLKRDARGYVRSTLSQRETVIAEFARSGLSGPAFARLRSLTSGVEGVAGVR